MRVAARILQIAMSSLRQGEGAEGVWQVRQYGLERAPGVGHAVQKECGNSRWVSLLDIGKPDPIRKLNRLDDGCHVYIFGRKRPVRSMYVRYESPKRRSNFSSSVRVRTTKSTTTKLPVSKRNQFAAAMAFARMDNATAS